MMNRLIDLTEEQTNPAPRSFVVQNKTVQRSNKDIDSIVLHQTGIEYSVSERQLQASDGDYQLALARRFMKTPYHYIICPKNELITYHSPGTYYLQHANTLNKRSIGVSIHGLYTFHNTNQLTEDQKKFIEHCMDIIMFRLEKENIHPEFVFAHRQSSATRKSDPGEEIYKTCLSHLIKRHNLLVQYDHRENDGNSIPDSWRLSQ